MESFSPCATWVENISEKHEGTATVSLSNFSPGVYVMLIELNNTSVIRKIVKL